MATRSVYPTELVLASMVALLRDARQYRGTAPLVAAYAASVMKLGLRLRLERRAPKDTQTKPSWPTDT